ncbi:Uridylate kinase [Anaerohalosphaera lusitana]|uniref:Uridylate kinase n=1 Tax=Anaerohalosphaera lusitana TaxID=1936003 RepID=A0A1U9NRD4_9BACT|nr:UMP kinase [Anaerohalosphaera lusitana]AQT70180.1 Uridylate kinase [Anaerohalosphaera lusitana]
MSEIKYKRLLLKLSGETFCKPGEFGINGEYVERIAARIAALSKLGVEIAVVVGGGNFLRGEAFSEKSHIPRHTADYMGMLATVMNAAALQETLESIGQPTRVLSAIEVSAICEPFIRRRCLKHFEEGRVVILAGGTGNPFFSTDTCAALRAAELQADLLIKATKVDGVYTDDPMKNPDAKLLEEVSYTEVLQKGLKVMDPSAVSLCRDNNIPVVVLNIFQEGNITKVLKGERIGTVMG